MNIVNKFLISLLLGAVVSLITAETVEASTYNCTAVDEKASVAVASGSSVAVVTSRKQCRFSVDGETVDERQTPTSRQRLNSLLSGGFDSLSRSSPNADEFLRLMIGPFAGPEIDYGTRMSFGNSIHGSELSDLGRCISNARSSYPSGSFTVDSRNVFCGIIVPRDYRSHSSPNLIGDVEVVSSQPIFAIQIKVEERLYSLFVPQTLLEQGRAGFRFR